MMLRLRLRSICMMLIGLMTLAYGCGFTGSQPNAVAPLPSTDGPRTVTDLSEVAPGNPLSPFGKQEQTIARRVASDDNGQGGATGNLDAVGDVRHIGDDKHPGEERLLNKKAAQFSQLSMRLMDQIFIQMRHLQDEDQFSRLKLPTDLKWVIILGTLNSQGVLKELELEQHSGMAAVDKMVIAACKKGLFIRNPPAEAADSTGGYKVRVEARFENFASSDGEHWQFKTYIGLAIL